MPTLTKHPRLRTVVRKTVKWGGAVLTVLLLVVWIGSGWWQVHWRNSGNGAVGLSKGRLGISMPIFGEGLRLIDQWVLKSPDGGVDWWFSRRTFRGRLQLAIPLWPAALLSLVATAAAWRADTKYLRRVRVGLCTGCGYDRAGLAAGAVCPECGKQPEAR